MEIGISVPDDIFRHFASDPIGPMLTVSRVVQDSTCPINSALNSFLDDIPSEAIATTYDDLSFSSFWKGAAHLERRARIWIAERAITKEISRRRIQLLQNQGQSERPDPYRVPALADLEVDDEQLVKLSEFNFDGSRLLRNGHAFTPFCTTRAPNSTYWLLDILFSEGLADRCSVRLDPFLFGPAETFPAMSYKMWIHGRLLDWKRLSSLSEPDFGRWIPDSMKHWSEFTDFCWKRRANEVHFACEEIPNASTLPVEGARYLHAIYVPGLDKIVHLDGALRLFGQDDLAMRRTTHIKDCGKLGFRRKIFRTDEPIETDAFGTVARAFFIWNEDVQSYFSLDGNAV